MLRFWLHSDVELTFYGRIAFMVKASSIVWLDLAASSCQTAMRAVSLRTHACFPRATGRDGLREDIAIKDIYCDCKAIERAVRHEWEGMTAVARIDGCLGCHSACADPYDDGMGAHYLLTMGYDPHLHLIGAAMITHAVVVFDVVSCAKGFLHIVSAFARAELKISKTSAETMPRLRSCPGC